MSIRKDLDADFKFPEPQELKLRLKDVLEPQVDEKYYLSDEQVSRIKLWEDRQIENGRGFRFNTHEGDEIATTMTTSPDRPSTSNYYKCNQEPIITEPKDGVAIRTANKVGYDMATDGDSVDLSYPQSKTKRGRVGHEISKTLMAADCMGTVESNSDTLRLMCDKWGYEKRHKDSREILQTLRNEIGEKAFSEWALGGLWCILSEAVLWEGVHAKGIFENWLKRPNMVECTYFSENSQRTLPTQEGVRNMWIKWQDRYPSYRRQLQKQQFEQLKSIMQKLPHEDSSWQEFVQDLWATSEGLGVLRQALSEIQEIWQPDVSWKVQRPNYRIRKLVPLETWRLMSFDDEDFDKAKASGVSDSQLYRQAGNSIVVKVLEGILRNLLIGQ